VGIDQLMPVIRLPILNGALLIVIAAPGIYACIQLHPYEYIYYNSLIGGVSGANRKFESDYWATSFQKSIQYINENAEPGATIAMALGSRQVVADYVRPDLSIGVTNNLKVPQDRSYYLLSSTRANNDLAYCQNIGIVFAVQRDGALLSYVKQVAPGQTCKK
jgi:hypothetical protein